MEEGKLNDYESAETPKSEGLYMGIRAATLRTNCRVKRSDMAKIMGVTQPSIYQFETTGNVRGESLRLYLNALYNLVKVNPAYIILENITDIPPFLDGDKAFLKQISDLSLEFIKITKEVEALRNENKEIKKMNAVLITENKELDFKNNKLETMFQSIKSM